MDHHPHQNGQPVQPAAQRSVAIAASIPLSRPIQGHTGPITAIELRQPTFGDWLECGEFERHYMIGDPEAGLQKIEISVDPEAVGRWFQRLSGLHMGVLTQIALEDSRAVYRHLQRIAGSGAGKRGN